MYFPWWFVVITSMNFNFNNFHQRDCFTLSYSTFQHWWECRRQHWIHMKKEGNKASFFNHQEIKGPKKNQACKLHFSPFHYNQNLTLYLQHLGEVSVWPLCPFTSQPIPPLIGTVYRWKDHINNKLFSNLRANYNGTLILEWLV